MLTYDASSIITDLKRMASKSQIVILQYYISDL